MVEGFDRADPTVHDPHCIRLCPSNPDRLYQQNHCGIYRIDRPSNHWVRIGVTMAGVRKPNRRDLVLFALDAGTLALVKTGPGTVVLNSNNSYSS